MITITKTAAAEIKRVISEKSLEGDVALRIGIKGGGCAGFNYVLDFTTEKKQFDEEFESEGLKVIVDRKSLIYIDGTELDFNTNLTERGFKFNNPKADASCGCGTSFSPKAKQLN